MLSQSSFLLKESNLQPHELNRDGSYGKVDAGSELRRKRSSVSELSRIISGIKDDIGLDNSEYEDYKVVPVEETLMVQLDQVSRRLSQHSEKPSSVDLRDEKGLDKDSDHPIDCRFAFWQSFLAMLLVFLTWGANAAFGVFLNLYLHDLKFTGATMYDYALMGGLVVSLANLLCPFTVIMIRIFGQTPVLISGIIIQTAGYLLAAECKRFWQLFLCQGFMVGLSFALIVIPGTLVIPTWFDKHLATAMGIAVSGAGLGGLVFSFVINLIIEATGNQKWALRAVGLINLGISVFATLFMRVRNKQPTNFKETLRKEYFVSAFRVVFDVRVFKGYALNIASLWFSIVMMGYMIVLFSVLPYASSQGLSSRQATNVLAVLNALQLVGRPAVGRLGDYFGRNNTSLLGCCYVGVLLLAFWLNAKSYVSIMILAALLGAPAGIGSTMAQSMAADVLKFHGIPQKLPAAWSGMNIVVSFFVLPAEVIALKLKSGNGSSAYRDAQIFASCTFFFGALLLLVNREWLVRKTLTARRTASVEQITSKKSSYLQTDHLSKNLRDDELEDLNLRIARYDRLLAGGPAYFTIRAFYPIRV